ncbi:hypothetical protein SCG7086_AB_00070 [Chlamydiales bacterium SCGC AG-110-P3]|nr:hypothetical protein SCG7086_AB_00070 [Chlamydiales bacterium SCGC AG-110-P3]
MSTQGNSQKSRSAWTLFKKTAAMHPDRIAVIDKTKLSFSQLMDESIILSTYFANQGVRKNERVALISEPSSRCLISLLALFRCGAVIVPIDNRYPGEKIKSMTELVECSHVIFDKENNFSLDDLIINHEILKVPVEPTDEELLEPDELCSILFTSGTTGIPKGVAVPLHHYLPREMIYNPYQTPITVFKGSISWASVLPFRLRALIQGNSVLVIPYEKLLDPHIYLTTLLDHRVEDIVTVPSHLELLFTEPSLLTQFKHIHLSSEAVDENLVDRMQSCFPEMTMTEHYGCTETLSYGATRTLFSPEQTTRGAWQNDIGSELYIIDEHGQQTPEGEEGEIAIAGPKLSLGYIDSTVDTPFFSENHFSEMPLYRTGDRAIRSSEKGFLLVGRKDKQIQIHGIRIQLTGIEHYALTHPDVEEAVAVPVETKTGLHIALYLSPDKLDPTVIKSYLSERLPNYSLPTYYALLPTLPRLLNGKVDYQLLKECDIEKKTLTANYVAPRCDLEQKIVEYWEEVLSIDKIGIEDDFFDIGGHSLLATKALTRIQKLTGVQIPILAFFQNPTIDRLMTYIQDCDKSNELPPIEPQSDELRQNELPLSFNQARLWFLEQLNPMQPTYNIRIALKLSGQLNKKALTSSINQIYKRHEILRSSVGDHDGMPYQRIRPFESILIPIKDLSSELPENQEEKIKNFIDQYANQPFDLNNDPLFRVHLLKLSEEEHILQINIHHSISDGWSVGIFYQELSSGYDAYVKNIPSTLPALPIQYTDFAHWQRQYLTPDYLSRQLEYWKTQFRDVPELLPLPLDYPRTPQQGSEGKSLHRSINRETHDKFKQFYKIKKTTSFMTLFTILNILLHRYTNQSVIPIGLPIANRRDLDVENLIGFFVNTLVIPTDLGGNLSFTELLNRVKESTLQAHQNQDVPFDRLVSALNPKRDSRYHPIFQVMLTVQNMPRTAFELPNLSIVELEVDDHSTLFDLRWYIYESDDHFKIEVGYNEGLFKEASILTMIDDFELILQFSINNPNSKLNDFPTLNLVY